MQNRHPADRLADVRIEIKKLGLKSLAPQKKSRR